MPDGRPIPQVFQELIDTVKKHHESMGTDAAAALAEIRVHSIMATERVSEVYEKAGDDLKAATIGLKRMTALLAVATLVLALVTALAK